MRMLYAWRSTLKNAFGCERLLSCLWAVWLASTNVFADDAALLEKHVRFLRTKLDDSNEVVRAQALDVLAEHELPMHLDRLRRAIQDPSDVVQMTALARIRGHASSADLTAVIQILADIELKANDPDTGGNLAIVEMCGLDVLLTANEEQSRSLAVNRIRTVLLAENVPLIRWSGMVDLVCGHELIDLVPVIKQSAVTEERQLLSAIGLAALGDMEAQKLVRQMADGNVGSPHLWLELTGNSKAVRAAGVDVGTWQKVILAHRFQRAIDRPLILAALGNCDELFSLINKGTISDTLSPDEKATVVTGSGAYGDQRFVLPLDSRFDSSDDLRVEESAAIIRILDRFSVKK